MLLARLEGHDTPIAIKRSNARQLPDCRKTANVVKESFQLLYDKEAIATQFFSHVAGGQFFPKMLGMVRMGNDACMVTEFVGNRATGESYTLLDAVTPEEDGYPSPRLFSWKLAAILEDVIRGLMMVHSVKYLHNDVKGDNISLEYRGRRWHGVIIDFGLLSTIIFPYIGFTQDPLEAARDQPTRSHIAPEVLAGGPGSVQSDVYAVGHLVRVVGELVGDDELMMVGGTCTRD